MREVLIQDDGAARGIDTYRDQARMHGLSATAYADYCVKNMGWARIRYNECHVVVHFRPRVIHDVTIAAMCYALLDLDPVRIGLVYFAEGQWEHELSTSVGHCCDRIAALLEQARNVASGACKEWDLVPPDLSGDHPFHGQLAAWQLRPTWRQFAELLETADTSTDGRFVLFEYNSGDGSFRFADFGNGLPACALSFLRSAKGMPVESGPDARYGHACREAYWRASESLRPKLQAIDAYVDWPGYGTMHRKYTRLLLPMTDPSGRSWLLSSSLAMRGGHRRAV